MNVVLAVSNIFSAFWSSLLTTAPFLMVGLFSAGLLHVLIPPRIVLWAMGGSGFRGALRGALLGLPLPLCSCGVVPTAIALKRQGASISATAAFTISTPETSIDALSITAALLPGIFLGLRPLAAILLAVFVGVAAEWLGRGARGVQENMRASIQEFSQEFSRGATTQNAAAANEICRVCGLRAPSDHTHGLGARALAVLRYAYGVFFDDIAFWLVVGLGAAAAIEVYLPDGLLSSAWLNAHHWVQVVGAMVVGIPLYSCATGTTPLVAVLLAKGLSPGAALAFLLSAPATNPATVYVLRREWGTRVTVAYYAALFGFCILLGLGLDALWPRILQIAPGWTALKTMIPSHGQAMDMGMGPSFWSYLQFPCAVLLSALCVKTLFRSLWGRFSRTPQTHDGHGTHGASGSHDCCDE